jgi:hypothetical protein
MVPQRPQLIESRVRGDAAEPRAEAARRVEARSRTVNPPEGFNQRVLRRNAIPDDAENPVIDLAFVLPIEPLERVRLSMDEPGQQLRVGLRWHRFYEALLADTAKGSRLKAGLKPRPTGVGRRL